MRIKKMRWWKYKGLADGELNADGRDMLITGRNGAGKSSIAEIPLFVLKGKGANNLRCYDESGIAERDDAPHGAELEFDNGLILGREVIDTGYAMNSTRLYINGQKATSGQFVIQVNDLTHGGDEFLINPMYFPTLAAKKQREFLIKTFCTSAGEINGAIIPECEEKIRKLKKDLVRLEGAIDEQKKTLEDEPKNLEEEIAQVAARLAAANEKLAKLSPEAVLAQEKIVQGLEHEYRATHGRYNDGREQYRELGARYKAIKDTCPTCGAKLSAEKVAAAKKPIAEKGEIVKQELIRLTGKLKKLNEEWQAAQIKLNELKSSLPEARPIQDEIYQQQEIYAELKGMVTAKNRLMELGKQTAQTQSKIAEWGMKLQAAQSKIQEQIEAAESELAAKFEHVRFKLWDVRATGEVIPTCEVILAGVPFQSLSTGEQFKAACDILNAMQNHFGAELPLMIDDAESLSMNSLLPMPNQKFFFRVSDEDLRIEAIT